jgi:O-antigen ligase
VDNVELSSGRTEFWAAVLEVMNQQPFTYITGYGWDAYTVMAFRIVAHNDYLTMLFDIGLIGLGAFLTIIALLIRDTSQAAARAEKPYRAHLMAFVFGFVSLATTLMFVNLYEPWPYVWAYAGLIARLAVSVRAAAPSRSPRVASASPAGTPLAPAALEAYGWSGRRKPS